MRNLGRAVGILAAVVACAAIAACGRASTTSEHAAAGTATYAVSLANPTPSYLGNYIYITGKRDGIADLKYPCASQFAVCVPIDQYGKAEPIKNLCPTPNDLYPGKYPDPWNYDGTWTFTYDLYSNSTCTNPPMTNLDCPDTMNETLGIGETKVNNIICITHNAEKDVNVCVVDPATGAHTGTNCCMPSGAVCGGANDPACCTGMTCNSGICSAPACGTAGAACGGTNPACCNGMTCNNSVCTPVCAASGGSCTTDQNCCAGLTCNSGSCSVPACKPVTIACTATADCCTGLICQPIAGQNQCCVPDGGVCTIDLNCCNGLCFDGHCFQ